MKILAVDEHVLFREGLVNLLNAQPDIQVVGEAGSVREAIVLAQQSHPDVILMDYALPDGNGANATQAILALDPGIKIIFLTRHETDQYLFSAIRAGADGYLLKNLSKENLMAALRGLERGEAAISRTMVVKILEAFRRSDYLKDKDPDDENSAPLTSREMEILAEIAAGRSNSEIATRFYLSESTVKNHVHNVLKKLGLKNRREVTKFSRQNGLIQP